MRWTALGLLIALTGACGSQVQHDEIVTAWEYGQARAGTQVEPVNKAGGAASEAAGDTVAPANEPASDQRSRPAAVTTGRASAEPGPAGTNIGRTTDHSGRPEAIGTAADSKSRSSSGAASKPGVSPIGSSATQTGKGEIVIGNVSTLSGPVGAATSGGAKTVSAWVAAVNAAGGVNGYRIKLRTADDGSDPARHRSLVQEMVERAGVIAFVHNASALGGGGAVSYIQAKRIPVIGSEGGSYWMNKNSMYFPQMPSLEFLPPMEAGALAQVALPEGKNKIAMFVCEFQSCDAVVGAEDFTKAGFKVVHNAKVSITQPDYTAECLAARNAGAEIVFFMLTPDGVSRFAESCTSVGLKPLYSFVYVAIAPSLLELPELEGATWASPTVPFFFTGHPSMAEFASVMARYAPGVSVDASAATGWVTAKLFEKVLSRIDAAQPGPADILKGLWSIDNDDLGGITNPLTYKDGDPNNAVHIRSCWWTVRVQAKRWISPDGGQRHCA